MIQTIYAKLPREKIEHLTRPEFINGTEKVFILFKDHLSTWIKLKETDTRQPFSPFSLDPFISTPWVNHAGNIIICPSIAG